MPVSQRLICYESSHRGTIVSSTVLSGIVSSTVVAGGTAIGTVGTVGTTAEFARRYHRLPSVGAEPGGDTAVRAGLLEWVRAVR